MDERKHYTDWDDSVYGTGPTQPPKNRGGVVALMLILIIFLCGIITVLGILNVRLFRQLELRAENELSISYTPETTVPPTEATAISEPMIQMEEPIMPMDLQQSPASVSNIPQDGGLSLQEIYMQNIPSVVSIVCNQHGTSSTGTGVILSADGYIVTNAHVVKDAVSVSVLLSDNRQFYARIIGSDEISDLAVLYIETTDLIPAKFGDSGALRVGDTVTAIGDPLGVEFRGTYTNGIVSAINRDVELEGRVMTLIQTNAALNSGNSGGPLINCYGQVVGINTMKIGGNAAGVEGLGFAIPSTTVKDVVDQLVNQGYVSGRPTLGIKGEALSPFYQYYYHLPAGLYITSVEYGSDAYKVGIEEGDLLLSIGGTRITSYDELRSAIFAYQVGDTVEVVVYRGSQQYLVELTLSEAKG